VNLLLAVLTAVVVSIAVIPLMIRLAPRLHMVDLPDPRKVHARPVPRVGGIGIALGTIIAIVVLTRLEGWLAYYVAGALVLLVFGALDDAFEMGHYAKFLGQAIAVVPLVYAGDLWISTVPFLTQPLPPAIGKAFTVFAIVGVINALNHSDGLDGLAGGEAVLSLCCIAYLANAAGDMTLVLLSLAALGGIFGFLRFNTHPARVFMGDAGSQFIGFSIGVFTVLLTQRTNTGLSMALPLLIIGLPIVDILAVFAMRIAGGMNWFKATKNHIHHRLLGLGFDHYQAVLLIYGVQTFFVSSAIAFRYEADAFVTGRYLVPCAVLFSLLTVGERTGWSANAPGDVSRMARIVRQLGRGGRLSGWLVQFVALAVPLYLLAGSFAGAYLPAGSTPALAAAAVANAAALAVPKARALRLVARGCLYGLAALWVFAVEASAVAAPHNLGELWTVYFAALALAVALVWKFAAGSEFAPTTLDFLIAVLVSVTAFVSGGLQDQPGMAALLVKIVILVYACELVEVHGGARGRAMLQASGAAAAAIALVRLLAV
jgi:UDP-GlcNAc:undecaprenyl-phosphate GlcNAc-1-phosphate transferase